MNKSLELSKYRKKNPDFKFSISKYVDEFTPVKFICREHGAKCSTLPLSLRQGFSKEFLCPLCRKDKYPNRRMLTDGYYRTKALRKYGDKYSYLRVTYYVSGSFPIPIYCKSCRKWRITSWATHLLYQCKCNQSKGFISKNSKMRSAASCKFVEAKKRHTNFKCLTPNYTGFMDSVKLICKECNSDKNVIQQYFNRADFIKCDTCSPNKSRWGTMAGLCISEVIKASRLKFSREVYVSGMKYRIDALNRRFSIALEFNGDSFHGNPKKYSPRSKPNIYSSETANSLYRRTREREKDLTSEGYSVISIWENDWVNNRERTLARVLARIETIKNVKNNRKN